ncbi:syncollin [Microcaecilia unicolor]|uniref:Syncollin n=1 Tax=Microcaecilia unicolor TaxID=1415580 RepID=A0A6P7ZK68_9AMPH|nr:syncollin [Microcaecilia unicolor]
MQLGQVFCLLPLLLAVALAQCPQPSEIKDAEGNKVCARMFEKSNAYYDQCCGGEYLDAQTGDDMPYMPLKWINRISSLVVATRCELTVWSKQPKAGNMRKFTAGITYRLKDVKKGLFGTWDNAISSYYCKCN